MIILFSVHGGWSPWSSWEQCSTSCDGGVKQRSRACDNPSPGQYGNECDGDMTEEIQCNTDSCNGIVDSFVCLYHIK